MSEGFLARAKADGQVFVKTVSLLSKISKAKLAIRSKQRERRKVLTAIGGAVFDMYHQSGTLNEQSTLDLVGKDFDQARRIDDELQKLEAELERLKSSFKHGHTHEDMNEDEDEEKT